MTDHHMHEGHAHSRGGHHGEEEKPPAQAGIGPEPPAGVIYTCPLHPKIR